MRFGVDFPVLVPHRPVVGIVIPGGIQSESPRVLGLLQALFQLSTEILLHLGVFRFAGEVVDLARILSQIVKFLGGTLGEGEVVKALEARLLLVVHEQGLGG